jgi:hypothetical protein
MPKATSKKNGQAITCLKTNGKVSRNEATVSGVVSGSKVVCNATQ